MVIFTIICAVFIQSPRKTRHHDTGGEKRNRRSAGDKCAKLNLVGIRTLPRGFPTTGATIAPLIATSMISRAGLPWYSWYYVMVRVLEHLHCGQHTDHRDRLVPQPSSWQPLFTLSGVLMVLHIALLLLKKKTPKMVFPKSR